MNIVLTSTELDITRNLPTSMQHRYNVVANSFPTAMVECCCSRFPLSGTPLNFTQAHVFYDWVMPYFYYGFFDSSRKNYETMFSSRELEMLC
jgi:hypothetical protein